MEQRLEGEVRPVEDLTTGTDGDIGIALGLEAVFLEEVEIECIRIIGFERFFTAVLLCRMDSLAPHGLAGNDIVEQVDIPVHFVFAFEAREEDCHFVHYLCGRKTRCLQEFLRIPNGEILRLQIIIEDARFAERIRVLLGAVLPKRNLLDAYLEAEVPSLCAGLHHLLYAGTIRSAYFRAVRIG